jgi:hypothetical protein
MNLSTADLRNYRTEFHEPWWRGFSLFGDQYNEELDCITKNKKIKIK